MRRSFDKNLLPQEPPPSQSRSPKKEKIPDPLRCPELGILLTKYRTQVGDRFSLPELARLCGVKIETARKWFYGYAPSYLVYWIIARYFERHLDIKADLIKEEIETTITAWRRDG